MLMIQWWAKSMTACAKRKHERAHRATHTDDSDAVAISLNISKATTKQSLVRNVPSIKSWWCWFPNHGMLLPCCGSSQALVWFRNLGTFQAAAHHLAPRSWRLERFHARELCSHVIWLAHHHIHHLAVDSCGYQPLLSILRSARRH